MTKVLEVKNITKIYKIYKNNFDRLKEIFTKKIYYKKFIANDNISFDLHEGETLGIIGMNGAGKSTILKQIVGVVVPTSGEIIRHGRVTALLELGTGFNDELSGYENIFMNGTLIGMSYEECKKNAQNIIDFSELGEYIDEPVKTYSSGMKMRLAFSIAIYSEPKILIVDEALAVGDAHFSAKCTQALKERKEKNMSIIYVSHDLNSLKILCNRVILLENGKIIEEGEPETVVNKYNFLISKLTDKNQKMSVKNTKNMSYGTFDVEIKNVRIYGINSNTSILHSGEEARIIIELYSKKMFENISIGVLIKDKLGQDIFGTNTYYQSKKISVEASKYYICEFLMPLNIGVGFYTLTAAIHLNENHLNTCYHWIESASKFEIMESSDYKFIGLCKLSPYINFYEKNND